ncbi:MAG: hypothetical protein LBG96_10210 [Tannerella sp.]|nr:hypothetical protein [Tannerella sp.]
MIPPTHTDGGVITVRQAIGHLPKVEDGQHCPDDDLHYPRKLSEMTKKRIKAIPEGGG